MSLVVSLLLARPGGDSGGAEAPPLRVRAHEAALEHACRRRHGPTPGAVRRDGQAFGESRPSIFTEHHRIDPLSCNEPREGGSYDPAGAAARGAHMPCSPAAAEAHPARATFAPSASFARLASPSCCGGGGWLGRWAHPRLIAPAASTGRVLDVLYLLRRLEDVSPLVPPPNEWAASGVPMLEEAIAFIEELVAAERSVRAVRRPGEGAAGDGAREQPTPGRRF
ncbi:hypothetical protein EMIHUDRAFT_218635 [Emiliania huxleyi CCMP1516]|uniref:Uncharacterized protein n=2 Tax=Emiliania huxleyi TaxID=2903 RepID=A0A0D3I6P1_EMIH1|nr:hypothetical protein EMIHUDRAFT_218635 [Emiliania huxleyi CCMP1516]EOD06926.1 hypothetical protein EMIHUDRAFT_218635 [Emiliania huxleyi CCMP1516]|eukprot:XP_005759355.1 hypothetical protein EMIHUDRAFT_218635 [Emiliania huxleyi CCMP1516]